jgi:hypothetical protein
MRLDAQGRLVPPPGVSIPEPRAASEEEPAEVEEELEHLNE